MRKPLFQYVGQILASEKYFDIGRGDIIHLLAQKGEHEFITEHDVTEDNGTTTTTALRLNITTRAEIRESWSVSIKLHGIRIDCIDHEPAYRMLDGSKAAGWHRHIWNPSQDSADKHKVPAPAIDGFRDRNEFLIRVFSEMKILLNKTDHGPDQLSFD